MKPKSLKDYVLTYTSHDDLYVLADHCPKCGVVPLHRGHDCSKQYPDVFPCPRCFARLDPNTRPDQLEECPNCPLCLQCCQYLRDSWEWAAMVADGEPMFPYTSPHEHDVRYVKMMQASIKAAKTPAGRTRLMQTLIDFLFAEALLSPPRTM